MAVSRAKSAAAWVRARKVLPGGVSSPVRAFGAVGGEPFFVARARGAHLWDADGNRYVDYVDSWGAMILGHAHPKVREAVAAQLRKGTSYGAPTELETELAELVCAAVPAVEMVRFVSSGTEAVMHALRLARGYTGREKLVKFAGNYHGASDALLVQAGSGALTLGRPDSAGVPTDLARHTLVAEYNDLAGVRALFDRYGEQIAAVVVEPVAGNCGVIPPRQGFLAGLRQLTRRHGALLLFDEVITGFRLAFGGAQELYRVRPDLVTLGKVLGGGLPVGAFGGRRRIMRHLAPLGPVYQAGTLSGNPLAMAAGLATLKLLRAEGVYQALEEKSAFLAAGLRQGWEAAGLKLTANRVGSMMTIFFTDREVADQAGAKRSDTRAFARFFAALSARGVAVAPSQFEAMFVSLAHRQTDLEKTLEAAAEAFRRV